MPILAASFLLLCRANHDNVFLLFVLLLLLLVLCSLSCIVRPLYVLFLQFALRFIIVLCLSVFCFSLVYFHHEEWQSGRSGSLTEARMVFRM